MTELLCKGTEKDREEIIDFANYVFSFDHKPHNFIEMVPRLYGPGSTSEKYHYLIRENGRIKALLCSFPQEAKVGETILKLAFIGTVSVHPYSRGKGYMKSLMNAAIEDMKRDGIDFAALGGQRQRYQYFGFEEGGTEYRFTFETRNLRHAFRDITELMDVIPLVDAQKDKWDRIYDLFQHKNIRGIRSREEFPAMLRTWNSTPYLLMEGGQTKGYFSAEGKIIHELVLCHESLLLPAIKSIMSSLHLNRAIIKAADYEEERLAQLSAVCEDCSISSNANYQIFHFEKVINAFFKIKKAYTVLQDGGIVLQIGNEKLMISVCSGQLTVGQNDSSYPIISLGNLEAVEFLTAPFSPRRREEAKRFPFLQNWFPIPLYTAALDEC